MNWFSCLLHKRVADVSTRHYVFGVNVRCYQFLVYLFSKMAGMVSSVQDTEKYGVVLIKNIFCLSLDKIEIFVHQIMYMDTGRRCATFIFTHDYIYCAYCISSQNPWCRKTVNTITIIYCTLFCKCYVIIR